MKPNNLIYRSIANKITGITFEKFYSSMYYMRAIAEYYNGEPYTGRKPSNKYIKDWYLGLTGESEPETHKYNLWYLREIVKFYDPQQSGLNENQCLSFIDDHIEPPSPVEFDSISLTVSNSILSYADGDTATLTAQLKNGDDDAHLSGKSVSFDVVDGQGTIISNIGSDDTDSNGIATVTYTATGVGDITIQASVEKSGIILTKTFVVQDCLLYRANPVACTSCNIDLPSSALVSYKMSKPRVDGQHGGVDIQLIDSSHTYFVGNWASAGTNGILIRNTGSSSNLVDQRCSDITANTEYTLGVTYDNGDWTYFKDDEVKSFSANYTPTKLSVINIQQGYMKDLMIKPL